MATLVLTAVGGVIGGPIGAALGGLVGQAVDHSVIRPARRDGPRLTDLAVQTSSYGTQIPPLFGTMRVAGTVIWSTDLQEHRGTSGGGKGQPSTATYSYSASFAVLLSARPILSVGRIWAEGKLLRGAAGDWKSTLGAFRLHAGGEDQAADPLIASAEGAALTPAHRGSAYAVFEDLQLADFGNRIPSLTFEVSADEGAVSVGAIAAALAPEVTGGAATTLGGFAASGGSVRAVLDTLAQAGGGWFAADGAGLRLRDGDAAADATIADEGWAKDGDTAPVGQRTAASINDVPRVLTVQHYDPARDYQTGTQRATRPGAGTRADAIELAAAIPADAAKRLATGALARAMAERVGRTVTTGAAGLAIAPGAAVTLAGEDGVRWRVRSAKTSGAVTTLALAPVVATGRDCAAATPTSPGRVSAAPDLVAGTTLLVAAELPPPGDTLLTAPRLCVVASGTGAGWRRAALLVSIDGGLSWQPAGDTAAPAVIGTVLLAPPCGPATLIDRAGAMEVSLARDDMLLGDADPAALDAGANLALAGGELFQFGRAEPLGEGRWRLSELWRGRRGTGAAPVAAGDRCALIDAAALGTIDLPLPALGRTATVSASGVGDRAGPALASAAVDGRSVLPPSPVHLRWSAMPDGGAVFSWVRRSRLGWHWVDGADAPLGEEREEYRVVLTTGAGDRSVETAGSTLALTPADAAAICRAAVVQRGTWGESAPAILMVGEG